MNKFDIKNIDLMKNIWYALLILSKKVVIRNTYTKSLVKLKSGIIIFVFYIFLTVNIRVFYPDVYLF